MLQQVGLKQLAKRFLPKAQLSESLERRIRIMAMRWRYTENELQEVLLLASANPSGWLAAVDIDERKFGNGAEWPLQ